ncbi:acetyl-CoA synthetase-like protein [Aspergillus pseudotamarii]|uniref:Acetyl-CoA synthetase-like protein n=1 Tax=Aspergillus pseudotamarii TaxID=132259 RepID=A0A5N6T0G6_ASPPS|nr:acetyl-CoA synthetase-like protein [Aspergillus pseudotamarii]KAE8139837.1 acetyl-CoA synthetase-like protein [Aspergillus pseudotamarii]
MTAWKFQPRLLTHALDQEAVNNPDRLFCIHSSSLRCADHGWRRVTVGALASAVDNFAWWLEKTIASRSTPERLVYIGPNDIRYTICMLACMKLGHCTVLLPPVTSKTVADCLIRSGKLSKVLYAHECSEKARMIRSCNQEVQLWEVADLWRLFDGPRVPFPCNSEYTLAGEQEPVAVLYSSGTTGLPKEIILPHGYFTALDYFQHIPVPPGRVSTAPWLSDPKDPHLIKTNLFHATGIITWAAALLHGIHFVISPDVALTAPLLEQVLAETGAKSALFTPDTLVNLGTSEEVLNVLAGLRCISFVGMPLPRAVGHEISQVTRLQSAIGLTEAGYFHTLRPQQRNDWEYFEWNPHYPINMQDEGNGYCQLVFRRSVEPYLHAVFVVLAGRSEFHTGDLYIQHPQNPMLWKNAGRKDNMCKLQNRICLYPNPIEEIFEAHSFIARAVVSADHRFRAVLIIEPDWKQKGCPHSPEGLVSSIWPLVEKTNHDLPVEANISKDRILVASIDSPFPTTAKGTVQRRALLEGYQEEISAISTL